MKYSLVGAAIIASTVMTAAAPVDDKGVLGPRSAAYAGLSQPSEEQDSLRRRENSAYFGGQGRFNPVPSFTGVLLFFVYVPGCFFLTGLYREGTLGN